MKPEEIIKQVNQIFITILDDEDIVLNEETTANDVDDWDSLTHIQLIVAIEKHFKIKFLASEIQKWKNVGDLCNSIQTRLAQ